MIVLQGEFMRIFLLGFILVGCASMKPNYEFCKKTDWRQLGIKDGKGDVDIDEKISQYKMMCRNFDDDELKPDITMYRFGHSVGVKQLCTPTQGFERGMKGINTSKNCDRKKHKKYFSEMKKGIFKYCSKAHGYNEAMRGVITSQVCTPKQHPAFYAGVKKGVKNYCTYQYGLRVGSLDQEYTGVCKGEAENEFIKGHTIGKTQSQIKKLRKQVQNMQIENAKLVERLNASEEENVRINEELRRVRRELKKVRAEKAKKDEYRVY